MNRLKRTLLLALVVLTAVAWLRGAEYDEQYTLFLTGGIARPIWPASVMTAGEVQRLQSGHASLADIADDLRSTDVHPPLYFWAAEGWRRLAGDSLFALRLASVLCSAVTLALVGWIARRRAVPAVPAMLLTLGCYGFAYTGAIARGFALAQMLSVAGVVLLIAARGRWRTMLAAGALLGAATFTNYLAVFVGVAALLAVSAASRGGRTTAWIGFALWLPADVWFLLAQRQARPAQFAPFEPIAAAERLARYAAANVFGGLPLYVDGIARTVLAAALALLLLVLAGCVALRWRHTHTLFAMVAAAPPIGLLLLGLAFNNTPIELRYLAFSTPFIGLLLAASLPRALRTVVLAIQAVAVLGLMLRPETMQPARAAARAATALVHDGIVLLPQGNDGVGIVGAFAVEAPPNLHLLIIRRDETAAAIRARAAPYRRVVLALLGPDGTSRSTLPVMRASFLDPCWRSVGEGFNVLAFERTCGQDVTRSTADAPVPRSGR